METKDANELKSKQMKRKHDYTEMYEQVNYWAEQKKKSKKNFHYIGLHNSFLRENKMEQVLLLDKLMNESPTTSELTPRSQLGMKVSNSLSGSQMREVGKFLKQKTRQSVFCSIE